MSATLQTLGIEQMTIEERLALVEAIWDSIAAKPEEIPLTEAQINELDRRLAAHKANPTAVIPWETIKAEALARMKQ